MDLLDPERRHEPLHPELQIYLYEADGLGLTLRAPLMYQIPLFHNGMANDGYVAKKGYVAECLANGDWYQYIHWHERPWRLHAFETIQAHLTDKEYWHLAASVWMDSENVHQNLEEWAEVFGARRKGRRAGLMTSQEYGRWRGLPETVTIYRGCRREINEDGWSWSLSREKAEWFATRFKPDDALVIEATIPRKSIVALFLGRGEQEVIAYPHAVDIVSYAEV